MAASYTDLKRQSSGQPVRPGSTKTASYQSLKKSIPKESFEQSLKQLQERDARLQEENRQKIRQETLQNTQNEQNKYVQEFKDSADGFWGSLATRFGLGVQAPTLQNESPDYTAYRTNKELENSANLNKSIAKNVGESAKKVFTENTTETLFDTIYQKDLDKQQMAIIEENTKKVAELMELNKNEQDATARQRRENGIKFLTDQNKLIAEKVGGEIKDKTNLQLVGQSVGTALELLPPTIGAGMTEAGKIVLSAGTKKALKAMGKEAVVYGTAVGASEKSKEAGASAGDIALSGAAGGGLGLLTVILPGLVKALSKKGSSVIGDIISKLSGKGSEELTEAESKIVNDIVSESVEPEVKTLFRGRDATVDESKAPYRFFTESEESAGKYAEIKKGPEGRAEVVSEKVDVSKFKEVEAKDYIDELKNPETKKNYLGVKFKDPNGDMSYATFAPVKKKPGTSESPILKEINKNLDDASKLDETLPTTTFKKQFAAVDKEIKKNKSAAYNKALRGDGSDEMTQSALQLSFIKNAIVKGDDKALTELGMAAARTGRKAGQTSVMFRALYDQDPMSRMLLNFARTKLSSVEARYPRILKKNLEEGSDIVKRTTRAVKKKAAVSLGDAQSIIDNFICK